jgi:adenylate kinase
MAQRYKSVLLFGAPGVGKGTQGKLMGAMPGFHHLATGDIFRALDKTSPAGKKFLEYSSRGELVPDALTIKLWQADVAARVKSGRYRPAGQLLVLDGIPRSVAQAQAMDPYIEVLAIIHLVAPDMDEMVRRMKKRAAEENRHDDADESVIRNRFTVYDKETRPVLDHYDPKLIKSIDAIGSPPQVLERIRKALAPILKQHQGGRAELNRRGAETQRKKKKK